MLHIIRQLTTVFSVRFVFFQLVTLIGLLSLFIGMAQSAGNTLTLDEAVKAAQLNDPWLVGNRHSQNAIESMSVAAGTLPDPKVTFGVANLPTDTFARQATQLEAMTLQDVEATLKQWVRPEELVIVLTPWRVRAAGFAEPAFEL